MDVVIGNQVSNSVSVLLGTGSGGFQHSVDYAAGGGGGLAWSNLADVNGDGKLDIITTGYDLTSGAGHVSVLLSNGAGGFATPTVVDTSGKGSFFFTTET